MVWKDMYRLYDMGFYVSPLLFRFCKKLLLLLLYYFSYLRREVLERESPGVKEWQHSFFTGPQQQNTVEKEE